MIPIVGDNFYVKTLTGKSKNIFQRKNSYSFLKKLVSQTITLMLTMLYLEVLKYVV
jgi:hypothetical protein